MVQLISSLLGEEGHEVVGEVDSEAAARRIQQGERFDLAVLDVVMPRISGDALADMLRRHDYDANVLFVTGYNDALFQARPILREGEQFLDKPFTREGLLEAVRMAVRGATHAAFRPDAAIRPRR